MLAATEEARYSCNDGNDVDDNRAAMVMMMASVVAAVIVVVEATSTATAKVEAMVTAVTLAAAGGGYHNSDGLTFRYAILLWYADVIDVRSNNKGHCALT
jgi:hypothetical protein